MDHNLLKQLAQNPNASLNPNVRAGSPRGSPRRAGSANRKPAAK